MYSQVQEAGKMLNEGLFENIDHNITAGDSYPKLHLRLVHYRLDVLFLHNIRLTHIAHIVKLLQRNYASSVVTIITYYFI